MHASIAGAADVWEIGSVSLGKTGEEFVIVGMMFPAHIVTHPLSVSVLRLLINNLEKINVGAAPLCALE